MRRAAGLSVVVAGALVSHCDGVPELSFAALDGGSEASSASDASSSAGLDAGCPVADPADSAVCCGSVPCSGDCAGRCPECESSCTAPGSFCCAKMNNIVCRQAGMTCN